MACYRYTTYTHSQYNNGKCQMKAHVKPRNTHLNQAYTLNFKYISKQKSITVPENYLMFILRSLTSLRNWLNVWFWQSDKGESPWLGCHCLVKKNAIHSASELQLDLLGQSTGATIKPG